MKPNEQFDDFETQRQCEEVYEPPHIGSPLEEADAIEWARFMGIIPPNTEPTQQKLPEILEAYRRTIYENSELA